MIIDARQLPQGYTIKSDICIVGAGAAGITLAHELRNKGMEIALLESGGMKFESDTQDLYKGEVVCLDYHGPLDQYRQRRFGGTTTVWGGRCAPFDEIDFEFRPHVPHSGWPISKQDLDLYYERAHAYCELGAYTYDVRDALSNVEKFMIPGFESEIVSVDKLWRFSPPINFGKSYSDTLKRSSNIKVYLHANCLKILTNREGTSVSSLKIASLRKNEFFACAKHYVLAAGGLEVTRLLLVSNDVHNKGIGNKYDQVGRFYISHITGDFGKIQFTPRNGNIIWDYEITSDGVYCLRTISVREKKQREYQLLNLRVILTHPPVEDPNHRSGILSSMYLVKRFLVCRIPPEYSKELAGTMIPYQHILGHLGNIMIDSRNVLLFSRRWINKRILSKRKLPSVMLQSKSNIYTLHFDAEQSPNPDSRVTLSSEKDTFGLNRLKVDWQCTDLEIQSVVKSCQLIGQELSRSGVGQLRIDFDSLPALIRKRTGVGSHHIGTTRMSKNPSLGVVNENCRVHDVDNLYILSSSVFPTSGCANPTLTILALALRFADHIKQLY